MRRLSRFIPALVLVVLYALIVVSPVAPLVFHSPQIAHALTGECAGECGLCGCSPERSASHSCCCWQKKLQFNHDDDQDQPACCKKTRTDKKTTKTIISSRPCDSGKTAALLSVEQEGFYPYRFNTSHSVVLGSTLTARNPHRQLDWLAEPPDHPPKITRHS